MDPEDQFHAVGLERRIFSRYRVMNHGGPTRLRPGSIVRIPVAQCRCNFMDSLPRVGVMQIFLNPQK